MYSLKVQGAVTDKAQPARPSYRDAARGEAGGSTPSQTSPSPSPALASPRGWGEVEQLAFSAGNPRVEHITGVVHLYRHISEEGAAEASSACSAAAPPPARSQQLCVLALPPDMGFPEFCTFLGAYFDRVRDIRLVRRDAAAKAACLVLLKFDRQDAADGFYEDFNNKPFCALEPEFVCRLLYVKDVEVTTSASAAVSSATAASPAPAPPPGTTELPSCPVCLERLDEHVSGVVTTVCNHRFHGQCLRQWVDTSCPVCRYCQHPTAGTSHCAACGTSADLWICLICGHVGCGRYRGSHAAAHWQASGHGYALELESQRVWDYASDAYVHRLVRSKTDGKIVEVPAPGGGRSGSAGARGECSVGGDECGECSGMGDRGPGLDPEVEEAMFLSKLDGLEQEYSHLLVSQLDAQRQHFEGLLEAQRAEFETHAESEAKKAAEAVERGATAAAEAAEAERRRKQLESKLADSTAQLEKVRKEKDFLKQLNDTLLANQKDFSERLKAAEAEMAAKQAAIVDLQEQVRDLMVFIEAQQTIAAEGGSEAAGGTVLPVPPSPQRRSRKKN